MQRKADTAARRSDDVVSNYTSCFSGSRAMYAAASRQTLAAIERTFTRNNPVLAVSSYHETGINIGGFIDVGPVLPRRQGTKV